MHKILGLFPKVENERKKKKKNKERRFLSVNS
jgi:hypothetical protein